MPDAAGADNAGRTQRFPGQVPHPRDRTNTIVRRKDTRGMGC